MKTSRLALVLCVLTFASFAAAADKPVASILPKETKWKLSFADEFDGDKLDENKWTPHDYGEFIRNHELQSFTSSAASGTPRR